MAKTKTIKAAPKNRNDDNNPDFTFRNQLNAVIRFNSASVLEIELNKETMALSVKFTDELVGYKCNGVVILED